MNLISVPIAPITSSEKTIFHILLYHLTLVNLSNKVNKEHMMKKKPTSNCSLLTYPPTLRIRLFLRHSTCSSMAWADKMRAVQLVFDKGEWYSRPSRTPLPGSNRSHELIITCMLLNSTASSSQFNLQLSYLGVQKESDIAVAKKIRARRI